jgi:DNA-binding transcriptional LysR family regulator
MELRHLRYFVAVAEEGHITRAAERLGMQQPPLSQQIRALEDELGVQLFRRKPRGVELTDAGTSLLADARAVLAGIETAVARARRTARGEQGAVVVGFTSSAPFHPFVPAVLRSFRERYPDVSVALEEAGTADLVEGVQRERVDAAFIRSPVADAEGLAVHALFDEPMVLALPAGHPLAADGGTAAPPLPLAAIAAEPLVLYRRRSGPGLFDAIIAACQRAGFSPAIAQEAPRIVSTLNLVAAGLGVSLVPESLGGLGMAGIAYRRLQPRPRLVAPLKLATRRTGHSAAAAHFVRLVRETARGSAV